jgi:hypothetical protein
MSQKSIQASLMFLDKDCNILSICPVKVGLTHIERCAVADEYKVENWEYYIILHSRGETLVGMHKLDAIQWYDFNRSDFSLIGKAN